MKQRIFNIAAVVMMVVCAGVIALQAEGGRHQAPAPPAQTAPQQQAPPPQQAQQGPPCIPPPPQMNQPQYQNGPQVNIGRRHGNLRQAQIFLSQASQAVGQAQQANEDELAGHAQRAKDLILQADVEIRLAANVSNEEGR